MNYEQGEFNKIEKFKNILEEIQQKLLELIAQKIGKAIDRDIKQEAGNFTRNLLDVALDLDEVSSKLLEDPEVKEVYTYQDGWFSRKGVFQHAQVFDGLHLLEAYRDNLRAFFGQAETKEKAMQDIIQNARDRLKEAQAALANWQEHKIISVVNRDIIQEWREQYGSSEQQPAKDQECRSAMSQEELDFFAQYEKELSRQDEIKEE